MRLSDMYPTTLLKAQDVTDAGGEMPVVIKDVKIKEFDGDNNSKESKPVLFFANDKQMVCNKTNGNLIASMLGNDTDLWLGKEITLIVMDVQFQDKMVPAIRVKNINSKEAAINAYWLKVKELGMNRSEGLDHLKMFDTKPGEHDFSKALSELLAPA